MLELAATKLNENHGGEMPRESADAMAERIVAEELNRLGWSENELTNRRKNDPEKLSIAARLKRETTLTLKQIVSRTSLGTSKGANMTLHRWMRSNAVKATPIAQLCL